MAVISLFFVCVAFVVVSFLVLYVSRGFGCGAELAQYQLIPIIHLRDKCSSYWVIWFALCCLHFQSTSSIRDRRKHYKSISISIPADFATGTLLIALSILESDEPGPCCVGGQSNLCPSWPHPPAKRALSLDLCPRSNLTSVDQNHSWLQPNHGPWVQQENLPEQVQRAEMLLLQLARWPDPYWARPWPADWRGYSWPRVVQRRPRGTNYTHFFDFFCSN